LQIEALLSKIEMKEDARLAKIEMASSFVNTVSSNLATHACIFCKYSIFQPSYPRVQKCSIAVCVLLLL
jgi:hypothetical protein